jgi:hypothetical protein
MFHKLLKVMCRAHSAAEEVGASVSEAHLESSGLPELFNDSFEHSGAKHVTCLIGTSKPKTADVSLPNGGASRRRPKVRLQMLMEGVGIAERSAIAGPKNLTLATERIQGSKW